MSAHKHSFHLVFLASQKFTGTVSCALNSTRHWIAGCIESLHERTLGLGTEFSLSLFFSL